jgi:hypothetical protein
LPPITNIAPQVAPVRANVFGVAGNFLTVCSQNRFRVAVPSILPIIANVCAALADVLVDVAPVMADITRVLPDISPVSAQVAPPLTGDSRDSTGRDRKRQK